MWQHLLKLCKAVILNINNISSSNPSTSTELKTAEGLDLPLSKKCRVSKAEKCLLCFVNDTVQSKNQTVTPTEKAKVEPRQMNKPK